MRRVQESKVDAQSEPEIIHIKAGQDNRNEEDRDQSDFDIDAELDKHDKPFGAPDSAPGEVADIDEKNFSDDNKEVEAPLSKPDAARGVDNKYHKHLNFNLSPNDFRSTLEYISDCENIEKLCNKFSYIDPFTNLLVEESSIIDSMKNLMNNKYYGSKASTVTNSTKRGKSIIETIWNAFRRTISLFDLFTDMYLLYLVSRAKILAFTVVLCASIICPYIVSYSCGVKLYFINGDLKKYVGLKKFNVIFGISPMGVLYFVLIDLIDVLFSYYKLIVIVFFGKSEKEMKLLEETVANQLGMSRMDYEGIKRQRATAMLMFETIPQAVLQVLLLFGVFSASGSTSVVNAADIDATSVYLSVFFATLNSLFQVARLKSESTAVHEPFYQYCLECLMARISWIPYKHEIVSFLSGNNNSNKICYNIKYSLGCGLSKLFGYKPKVGFDFSSMTIHQLIAVLDVPTQSQKNEQKITLRKDNAMPSVASLTSVDSTVVTGSVDSHLEIDFGKSLRLVNFEDLMGLLEACSRHNILISGFNSGKIFELISNCVDISRNSGKHVTNGKNLTGRPFVSSIYSLCHVFDDQLFNVNELESAILECMILNGFDMNCIDNNSGETIIFDLIRQNSAFGLKLLLEQYVKNKKNRLMLNYHNNRGISPLYLAIRQFISRKNDHEKMIVDKQSADDDIVNESDDNKNDPDVQDIYHLLIENGIEEASLNFPAFERSGVVRSILGYVLLRREWKVAQALCTKGARIYSTELSILIELYLESAYQSNVNGDEMTTEDIFRVLNNVAKISGINLAHLADRNGNNPIHRVFIDIQWKEEIQSQSEIGVVANNNGNDSDGVALSRLINVCDEWMLMENEYKKLPIEYGLKLLYDKGTNNGHRIDIEFVDVFNSMLDSVAAKSQQIFQSLTQTRLNEYKQCILHLRMLCMVEATTVNINLHDTDNNNDYPNTLKLLKTFTNVIGNKSVLWTNAFSKFSKIQGGVDKQLINEFVTETFGLRIVVEEGKAGIGDDDGDDGLEEKENHSYKQAVADGIDDPLDDKDDGSQNEHSLVICQFFGAFCLYFFVSIIY